AGIFRIFSGVALGGTSAVILNETKKHCCNPIKKREAHMNVLLDMAKNKLIAAENRAAHVKS
ncbi:MAG TPA: hypothetical protein VHM20_00005, partial [Gammaproteobacteria bacterium]|nr:hypothetical protein [Gammaproteobacteria bacterium]